MLHALGLAKLALAFVGLARAQANSDQPWDGSGNAHDNIFAGAADVVSHGAISISLNYDAATLRIIDNLGFMGLPGRQPFKVGVFDLGEPTPLPGYGKPALILGAEGKDPTKYDFVVARVYHDGKQVTALEIADSYVSYDGIDKDPAAFPQGKVVVNPSKNVKGQLDIEGTASVWNPYGVGGFRACPVVADPPGLKEDKINIGEDCTGYTLPFGVDVFRIRDCRDGKDGSCGSGKYVELGAVLTGSSSVCYASIILTVGGKTAKLDHVCFGEDWDDTLNEIPAVYDLSKFSNAGHPPPPSDSS